MGRTMPVECEHGRIIDGGDFATAEGCERCGIDRGGTKVGVMGDIRDELVSEGALALAGLCPNGFAHDQGKHYREAQRVLDSVPPGSYKRNDGTWARLEQVPCDGSCPYGGPCPDLYTETTDA